MEIQEIILRICQGIFENTFIMMVAFESILARVNDPSFGEFLSLSGNKNYTIIILCVSISIVSLFISPNCLELIYQLYTSNR